MKRVKGWKSIIATRTTLSFFVSERKIRGMMAWQKTFTLKEMFLNLLTEISIINRVWVIKQFFIFSCLGQLSQWPFHSVTDLLTFERFFYFSIIRALQSCRGQMCPFRQFNRWVRRLENEPTDTVQVIYSRQIRNSNHDIEWQHSQLLQCFCLHSLFLCCLYVYWSDLFRSARTSCTTSDPSGARKIWITYIQAYMP